MIHENRKQHLLQLIKRYGSQTKLAEVTEIAPSLISRYVLGEKPFGEKMRTKIEKACNLPIGSMDLPVNDSNVAALEHGETPPEDSVFIPEYTIKFSAGNGRTAEYTEISNTEPATYRLSWFIKERINPSHAKRFRVHGDSMEPLLFENDTILVNLAETTIIDGKVYAIRYGDELRVKRLVKRLDGSLILRSENPEYTDEIVSPELADAHLSIIGRVRDKSGAGGL